MLAWSGGPSHRSTRPSAAAIDFACGTANIETLKRPHAPDRPAGAAATALLIELDRTSASSQTTTRSSTRRTTTVEMEPYDRLAECKNAHAIGWASLGPQPPPRAWRHAFGVAAISGQHSTHIVQRWLGHAIPAHEPRSTAMSAAARNARLLRACGAANYSIVLIHQAHRLRCPPEMELMPRPVFSAFQKSLLAISSDGTLIYSIISRLASTGPPVKSRAGAGDLRV